MGEFNGARSVAEGGRPRSWRWRHSSRRAHQERWPRLLCHTHTLCRAHTHSHTRARSASGAFSKPGRVWSRTPASRDQRSRAAAEIESSNLRYTAWSSLSCPSSVCLKAWTLSVSLTNCNLPKKGLSQHGNTDSQSIAGPAGDPASTRRVFARGRAGPSSRCGSTTSPRRTSSRAPSASSGGCTSSRTRTCSCCKKVARGERSAQRGLEEQLGEGRRADAGGGGMRKSGREPGPKSSASRR